MVLGKSGSEPLGHAVLEHGAFFFLLPIRSDRPFLFLPVAGSIRPRRAEHDCFMVMAQYALHN